MKRSGLIDRCVLQAAWEWTPGTRESVARMLAQQAKEGVSARFASAVRIWWTHPTGEWCAQAKEVA